MAHGHRRNTTVAADELRLGARWDLRGLDAAALGCVSHAVEELSLRKRARSHRWRLESGSMAVELLVGPQQVTQSGVARCVGWLLDWQERIGAVLPDPVRTRQAVDLHVRVPDATLVPARLTGIAERAAPTLLLLAGDGGHQPLLLEAVDDVLSLSIPGRLDPGRGAWLIPALTALLTRLIRAHGGGVPPDLIRHPSLCLAAPGGGRIAVPQRDGSGAPILADGRLTRVGGLDGQKPTPLVTAQQSLTVVFLNAEEAVSRLLPDTAVEPVRRTILGELPLWVDVPAERRASVDGTRPASAPVPGGRRPRSAARRRLTMVLVEPIPQPRPTMVWMARAMSSDPGIEVLVAPWHLLELTGDGLLVGGRVVRVEDGQVWPVGLDRPRAVDIALFDPSGNRAVGSSEGEKQATHRLTSAGVVSSQHPWGVLDRLLLEASRRGVVTNAIGTEFGWGPKHQLEFHLRAHRRAGGAHVPRPATFIVGASQVATAMATFARHGLSCVVKPARGSWGEGIQIIRPGAPLHRPLEEPTYAVQQLLPDPYLVHGRKIDLRGHILIDLDDPGHSGPVGPLLVRRVGTDYVRGEETAEIANVAYQHRRGLPAEILPLDQLAAIPDDDRATMSEQLDAIAAELVQAHSRWHQAQVAAGRRSSPSRRVVLWGVDALVRRGDDGVQVFLVENNVYPQVYRRIPSCDEATAAMLRERLVPALVHAARATA